ncbi:MAG: transcriptional regulator [Burkholderiaceae bacterium]|nr:transcriptional regulator [Burkholderiaceae bacterium]MCD8515826.1 transcriptional regulator [Burkholderiaceae bacterium]MCD8536174.1 transcriptional regulator [Burkholderiaceae bacterium]MCD8565038.1 transcriptional regulator [Burkholderiaceae bacterium]
MSQDTPNPFALPGMSAAFMSTPNNPLLTSMDMMRQAMSNMGYGTKSSASDTMVNPMAPEELEKRIADLRVVENWLKLNLSMLSSTIQGMEVQLATVKTLQSFVAMGQSVNTGSSTEASPLEVALGLKPASSKGNAPEKSANASQAQAKPEPNSQAQTSGATTNPQQAAAEGWWNMLENQFAQIAAATANAAKISNQAIQASAAQATAGAASNKAAAPKSRPTRKTTKSTRTPKKEA